MKVKISQRRSYWLVYGRHISYQLGGLYLRETRSSMVRYALILVKSSGGGIGRWREGLPFEPVLGCRGRVRPAGSVVGFVDRLGALVARTTEAGEELSLAAAVRLCCCCDRDGSGARDVVGKCDCRCAG